MNPEIKIKHLFHDITNRSDNKIMGGLTNRADKNIKLHQVVIKCLIKNTIIT